MTVLLGLAAAIAEIAGCFALWGVVRLGRSAWWLLPAAASLVAFALLTTQFQAAYAGRAYAAYGGMYIAAAVAWLFLVEGQPPDRWDLIGATLSVGGAILVLYGKR